MKTLDDNIRRQQILLDIQELLQKYNTDDTELEEVSVIFKYPTIKKRNVFTKDGTLYYHDGNYLRTVDYLNRYNAKKQRNKQYMRDYMRDYRRGRVAVDKALIGDLK